MKKFRSSLFLSVCFAITFIAPSTYSAPRHSSLSCGTSKFLISIGLVISNMFNQASGQKASFQTFGESGGINDCGASVVPNGDEYLVFSDTERGPGLNSVISAFSSSDDLMSSYHMQSLDERFDDLPVVLVNNGNGGYLFGLERDDIAGGRRRMTTFGGIDVVIGSLGNISQVDWAVQFNGTEDDKITDMIVTPTDFNPTFVAQTQSYGATTTDIQITQLTSDGSSPIFSARIGGNRVEVPFSIRNTANGFAVLALSNSYSLGVLDFDLFLLELNATGYPYNAWVFGSPVDETSGYLEVDHEGNYLYAATTYGFDLGVGNSTGKILYGKLAPGGLSIWNNVLLSSHTMVVTGLDIDNEGNMVVAALLTNSTTGDLQGSALKMDASGTFIEASFVGEGGVEIPTNLRIINNSYGVLTGCSTSYSIGGDEDVMMYSFPLEDLQGCGSYLDFLEANVTLLNAVVSPTVTMFDISFVPVEFNITHIIPSENNNICPLPTMSPSAFPTDVPTLMPTHDPTYEPTFEPTYEPTFEPTFEPTTDPTRYPTYDPTSDPTFDPTYEPTFEPTFEPTTDPTKYPTHDPTLKPTRYPTFDPTSDPTFEPTYEPTYDPTLDPTSDPTFDPTFDPTYEPTFDPTTDPTKYPTHDPTLKPTRYPTFDPTSDPTFEPTYEPTYDPTLDPTSDPTFDPTFDPTSDPTYDPTTDPTFEPTYDPTLDPTNDPTFEPTTDPTRYPTTNPTVDPTKDPTTDPTHDPTLEPTFDPTLEPTTDPTNDPTRYPTLEPTNDPTYDPTSDPTSEPTFDPTFYPTPDPTLEPTTPTFEPTTDPTLEPTRPTSDPTLDPTLDPTSDPTSDPTKDPTSDPTLDPTNDPTYDPTLDPTVDPTYDPTFSPTNAPLISYYINLGSTMSPPASDDSVIDFGDYTDTENNIIFAAIIFAGVILVGGVVVIICKAASATAGSGTFMETGGQLQMYTSGKKSRFT